MVYVLLNDGEKLRVEEPRLAELQQAGQVARWAPDGDAPAWWGDTGPDGWWGDTGADHGEGSRPPRR
jgi:hypothetical protein